MTAVLLERIEQEVPNFLSNVDVLAGCSGGGILALLLAGGYSPKECQTFLKDGGPQILASNFFRRFNIFTSRYSGLEKERLLKEYLGGRKLAQLDKHVVVTAFDLLGSMRPNESTGKPGESIYVGMHF